jgi:hypothetical protein
MKLREIAVVTNLVLFGAMAPGTAARAEPAATPAAESAPPATEAPPGDAPTGAAMVGPAPLLARLHQAAGREIQLADLAEAGGAGRQTRAYAADLAADFKRLDNRVVAFAAAQGISAETLDAPFPGENLVAMRQQVNDLGRLSAARGVQFDRQFWVTVAGEQAAASDMLPKTAVEEPSLAELVSSFGQVLETASARALVASQPTTEAPPTRAVNPPTETPPCAEACR